MKTWKRAAAAAVVGLGVLVLPLSGTGSAGFDTCEERFDDDEFIYVCNLYHGEILIRPPADHEVAYWVGKLESTSRRAVVSGIVYSVETFSGTTESLFEEVLGREADPAGLAFWTDQLVSGAHTFESMLVVLFGSAEYAASVPDDGDFLDDLYEFLGRPPDPAGEAFWLAALDAGATRAQVAASIFSSEEFRETLIAAQYDEYLDRVPSQAELDFWSDYVAQHGIIEFLVEVIASDEFFAIASDETEDLTAAGSLLG